MQVKDVLFGVPSDLPALHDSENPFLDADALLDAQITRVVVDVLGGTVGVLLELRQSSRLRGTTAVLRVTGVVGQNWVGSASANRFTAWSITDATVHQAPGEVRVAVHCGPMGALHITGTSAAFLLLTAHPDLEVPLPADPGSLLRFGVVDESTECDPLGAVHARDAA